MAAIADICPEILHHIFQFLRPSDLAELPLTCRRFNEIVAGNAVLYRDVYLRTLDDPKQDLDWEKEIRDLVRLQYIFYGEAPKKGKRLFPPSKEDEDLLPFVYDAVTRLLRNASPSEPYAILGYVSRNSAVLADMFSEEPKRHAFLCQSSLYQSIRSTERTRASRSTRGTTSSPITKKDSSAKLHCLYGRPVLNVGRTRSTSAFPYACARVYDTRLFTDQTKWGPFIDDGDPNTEVVDWEKMEAIQIVLAHSTRHWEPPVQGTRWPWHEVPFVGSWAGSYKPDFNRELDPLRARDPYGISGTWLRIVCFLDWTLFHAYQMSPIDADSVRPGDPINASQAIRMILMTLEVTEIVPPDEEDGPLPVVHFKGRARAWGTAGNSELKGTCRLTRENEVKWTAVSIFGGEERWRSECIQIGGLQSARGVMGTWFSADHWRDGPIGPTASWKISEEHDISFARTPVDFHPDTLADALDFGFGDGDSGTEEESDEYDTESEDVDEEWA